MDREGSTKQFQRWKAEIDYALKDQAYRKWLDQCDKIIKRYRDERKSATLDYSKRRFNILWANVQTLGPAVYGKMPKPIAERRFQDKDPAARLASMMLERTLAFQMDIGGFHRASKKAVEDYLLPGMGQLWVRYEPEFESAEEEAENQEIAKENASKPAGEINEDGSGEVYEKLSYERLCFDYVYYRDFIWSPARAWCEVPWIAKRCWLDKSQSEEQFGEEIANRMQFGDPRQKDLSGTQTTEAIVLGRSKKAEVWEIWCKPERKVYFISPDTPDLTLAEKDDPLHLENFFPCPEPLFATQTNDTLIPVPDYIEYQDQAMELDDLTDRIDNITTAVRANGVYNAEFPALQRLLQAGQDNKLIPIDDWAAFAEKGGIPGAMSLIELDKIIMVLQTLYEAREHTLQDCYQITGVSDIIRGASDPNETFGAQKIKANYATGRLGSRQEAAAFFCASTVRIGAEMIAEIFSDQSLGQMSGVDQMFQEQVQEAVEAVAPPPKPEIPPDAPPQAMQQAQMQWQQQWDASKRQAAQAKQQELTAQFQKALEILRSDKLRGFRVDIETDSTIADDLQQDKQAVTEWLGGLFESIKGAEATLSMAPELVKPLGQAILFANRKFRTGRSLEAAFEEAFDQLEKRIEDQKKQPPKPSPEEIKAQSQAQVAQVKAQSEQQRSQSEGMIAQIKAQAEVQKGQGEVRIQEVQLETERVRGQLHEAKMMIEALQADQKNKTDEKKLKLDFLGKILVAQIGAGAQIDTTRMDNELAAMLGLAQIEHEEASQVTGEDHDVNLAVQQQAHDRTMQKEAPKPNGKAI